MRKDQKPSDVSKEPGASNVPIDWIAPRALDSTAKHNAYCEVCLHTVSACERAVASCDYCNVCIHVECLVERDKPPIRKRRGVRTKWMCPLCKDDMVKSQQAKHKQLDKENYQKRCIWAQITISRIWRGYHNRKVYHITHRLLVRLQNTVKLRFAMKKFREMRKNALRPMRIVIHTASLVNFDAMHRMTNQAVADICAIVSTIDETTLPEQQLWKLESPLAVLESKGDVRFNSSLILGGVSGAHAIVITIVQKSTVTSLDTFLGQAVIQLEVNSIWKKGGRFNLSLHDIRYLLRDSSSQPMDMQYPSQYSMLSDTKSSKSWGHVTIDIDAFYGIHADCGAIYSSSLDDICRIVKKMPSAHNYSSPIHVLNHVMHHDKNGSNNGHGAPQTPLKTAVFPRLAIKRNWATIIEGQIYIHSRFGDPAKIVLNLKSLHLSIDIVKQSLTYVFSVAGFPEVRFSAISSEDELKWKVTMFSAKMYADDPHSVFNMEKLVESLKRYRAVKPQKPKRDDKQEHKLHSLKNENSRDLSKKSPKKTANVKNQNIVNAPNKSNNGATSPKPNTNSRTTRHSNDNQTSSMSTKSSEKVDDIDLDSKDIQELRNLENQRLREDEIEEEGDNSFENKVQKVLMGLKIK